MGMNGALLGLPLLREADCVYGKSLLKVSEILLSKTSMMLLLEPVHVSTTPESR